MSEPTPVGLQLYSVREDCGKDLAATLKAVADMGYTGVELAGTYDVPIADWKTMLEDNGLTVQGFHVGLGQVAPDALEATLDLYAPLGCGNFVVPALPGEYRESADGYRRAAEAISAAAASAASRGVRMGYHNHDFEFKPVEGQMPYDILLASFSDQVYLQFDFGWLYRGGQDGVQMVRDNAGRQRTVHIKAYAADDETAVVGADEVDWPAVFAICKEQGSTEHFIVEHERYADAPLVCVKQCLDNLRAMGV